MQSRWWAVGIPIVVLLTVASTGCIKSGSAEGTKPSEQTRVASTAAAQQSQTNTAANQQSSTTDVASTTQAQSPANATTGATAPATAQNSGTTGNMDTTTTSGQNSGGQTGAIGSTNLSSQASGNQNSTTGTTTTSGNTGSQNSTESTDCPEKGYHVNAIDPPKLVKAGCVIVGDVMLSNTSSPPWTKLYDDDQTTGLLVVCVRSEGCWVDGEWGFDVSPEHVNDIKHRMLTSGCGGQCKDVIIKTWPEGAPCDWSKGGKPNVCPGDSPPPQQYNPPTKQDKPHDCGYELKVGEKRTIPAGCIIAGDVYIGYHDGDWKLKPDSFNYTGMVTVLTKPAVVWAPYGAGVHPSDMFSADTVAETLKLSGCHLAIGCRFVDRHTW